MLNEPEPGCWSSGSGISSPIDGGYNLCGKEGLTWSGGAEPRAFLSVDATRSGVLMSIRPSAEGISSIGSTNTHR